MQSAADRLREALNKTPMQPPRCPVVSNVTAQPHENAVDRIRNRLVDQLTQPVRWDQGCRTLIEMSGKCEGDGIEWHELAPGRTLAGLMRRIDKNTKVETHDEPA
jgi:[acyl-carrier-protein] S-malonyltransferase